jgi:DNA-binding NarL/FixJ family response regulator
MQDIVAVPGVAVMLLAASEADGRLLASLRAGAGGLLLRDTDPAELVHAVRAVARGATVLSLPLALRLHRQLPPREDRMSIPTVIDFRRKRVQDPVMRIPARSATPFRGE